MYNTVEQGLAKRMERINQTKTHVKKMCDTKVCLCVYI